MNMLSSSREYLEALRNGNYLRFLQWPQFVAHHFQPDNPVQDHETMLDLLIYEWLNNGYCKDDAEKLALLTASYNSNSTFWPGISSYALHLSNSVVTVCMVYATKGLINNYTEKIN